MALEHSLSNIELQYEHIVQVYSQCPFILEINMMLYKTHIKPLLAYNMYMNSYLGNFNRIDRARNINPGKNCGSRKTTRRNFIDGRKERNAFKTN